MDRIEDGDVVVLLSAADGCPLVVGTRPMPCNNQSAVSPCNTHVLFLTVTGSTSSAS